MLTIKKVLYPTDFSDCAKSALAHAMFIAEQYDAELHVLHVNTLHGEGASAALAELPENLLEQARENAESALKHLLEPHRERPLRVKEFAKRAIYAEPAILSHIEKEEIDLVVMGTHGRRGWKRAFLGSVAEEVIRSSNCPVLAVHQLEGDDEGDASPSLTSFERLIVPIDFSEHSRIAFVHAVELAKIYDATIHMMHVVNLLPVPTFYSPMIGAFEDATYDEVAQKSKAEMQTWVDDLANGVSCELHVEKGDTADSINNLSETLDANMIVMATHGLTGFKHWLMGSHTERVIRYTKAPIFVVKSFGKSLLS